MTDEQLDDRGVPPVDYEQAREDAIAEALPMIRFWCSASGFGPEIADAVREAFADAVWDIAADHADRIAGHTADDVPALYMAIKNYREGPKA
jgi:hypothetical protein